MDIQKVDIQKVLHSKFNILDHKRTFTNYLEVVILEDGTIEYAIPSHQEKLISILSQKRSQTVKQVWDSCPKEYYFDTIGWLVKETGCIPVWNDKIVGTPNSFQMFSLRTLYKSGLYKGNI